MNFKIKRNELVEALNIVSGALPVKTPMPALTGILFSVENGVITIVTSNSEISLRTKIECDGAENGKALIPGKMFVNIIKSLAAENVEIKCENSTCEINADKGKYQLKLMDATLYPDVAFSNDAATTTFKISGAQFADLIKKVSAAVATSEKKPILTGVNIKANSKGVVATTTDTFRLSQKSLAIEGTTETEFSITIPMASVNTILCFAKGDEMLEFKMNMNRIFISTATMDYVSILLDGNYPDTARLTTLEFANHFEFDKMELLNAIDRAVILSPNDSAKDREITYNVVSMQSVDEKFSVLRVVNGMVGEANELVGFKGEGTFKFSVNGKYFADALKSLEGEVVKININNATSPFTVSSDKDLNNYQLLLPVRVE